MKAPQRLEDHLSRMQITLHLKQPTRYASQMTWISRSHLIPPGQCLLRNLFGLAPRRVYRVSPPDHSGTRPPLILRRASANALVADVSVALFRTFRWTGVTRYAALWCPDFPHPPTF